MLSSFCFCFTSKTIHLLRILAQTYSHKILSLSLFYFLYTLPNFVRIYTRYKFWVKKKTKLERNWTWGRINQIIVVDFIFYLTRLYFECYEELRPIVNMIGDYSKIFGRSNTISIQCYWEDSSRCHMNIMHTVGPPIKKHNKQYGAEISVEIFHESHACKYQVQVETSY